LDVEKIKGYKFLKILIIANSNIVFGKELKFELEQKAIDVLLIDFESLVIHTSDSKIQKYSDEFLKYKKIPKLSMFFRMMLIKQIISEYQFDIVNIHYSRWFYLLILKSLKKSKLIITFYGSDFYRTSNRIKNIQKKLYKVADAITFTNPLTKSSFLDYYHDFDKKSYVCRFGLKTLDYIDKNRNKNKKDIKKDLEYSLSKIIVTCGYNATQGQRHDLIIESLLKLDKNIVSKCQFIFPLTYGDFIYKNSIKEKLSKTNLDYVILEDFLYEDKNANIKLASDIMINILESDSFSGSMQEFLYAGNIVITGSWLPYKLFDEAGMNYHKIDKQNQLVEKLEYLINNFKNLNKPISNQEIVYQFSHWENTINQWIKVYKKVLIR
jgi:glycosyltransferase involved in cell wall biosynthesis